LINDRYKKYFVEHSRINSKTGKKVQVVDPEFLSDFLVEMINDEDISKVYTCFFGILISGGLRASEALSLKKLDFKPQSDGSLICETIVLKKRNAAIKKEHRVKRYFIIHPTLVDSVQDLLSHRRPQEFLFKLPANSKLSNYQKNDQQKENITLSKGLKMIKKVIGDSLDQHALRHATVSYMLQQDFSTLKISKLMSLNEQVVAKYAHVNVVKILKDLY
jgi:integrase